MSFLIRRNIPWTRAGWRDSFNRAPESPAGQPWGHYGGDTSFINSLEELQVPAAFGSTGKGPSYEFQPYTASYGMEWEMYWPVGGVVAQRFNLAILGNWAKVGGSVTAGPLIQCIDGDALGGKIYLFAADSIFDGGSEVAVANTSRWGGTSTVKVWVDDDKLIRIWRDGVPVLQAIMPTSHRTRLHRRGMNFFNDSQVDSYVRWIWVYDRYSDFNQVLLSGPQWTQQFYDDFDRPDGAVGPDWIQLGTNAAIVSNTWRTTGTTNGGRALLRDTGLSNGTMRVEMVMNPNSVSNSIILRGNAAGTDGLICTLIDGTASIARFTSALTGTSISGTVYVSDPGVGNFNSEGTFSACCNGDYAWIEWNGVVITKCQLFGGPGGSYAGARVSRNGSDSPPINSLRIMEATL